MRAILITILALLLLGGSGSYLASAATTNMDLTMSAGALNLASSGTASLSGLTVSTSTATSTGSIANVSITDTRGSGAGWSAVMTSQHFTTRGTFKLLTGSNATSVDFTGTYDGLDGVLDPVGTFIVEIVETGGAVGTAVFQFTDPAGAVNATSTTGASVTLSNGISATFATATYVIGDKWSVLVDIFPYTGLTVTPGSTTAASGSLTGITDGSAALLTGSVATSDAKTLVTADINAGFGDYDQVESLSLSVHANSLSGSFIADATITVS